MLRNAQPPAASPQRQGLKISADGYIRLPLATFKEIELRHLLSGLEEESGVGSADAHAIPIIGYTEWISIGDRPSITLGWDWQLRTAGTRRDCQRVGEPRSNVMLVHEDRSDLGMVWTSRYLSAAIDSLSWSERVLEAVALRYS